MGDEKNNLADMLQTRFSQELVINRREAPDAAGSVSLDELDFPRAAQVLLGSWRESLAKVGAISGYGQVVRPDKTTSSLPPKSFKRNTVLTYLTYSALIFMGITIIQFTSSDTTGNKLISSCVIGLLFMAVAWVVYEANKVSQLFRQRDKLRNIILCIVDNSVELKVIFTNTPRPWRELFMGTSPLDLEGTARLVAWNLDWYLKRPGFHFRVSWMVTIAICVCLIGVSLGMEPNYNFVLVSLLCVCTCLIIHSLESWRKLTGLALLIEETRRMFLEAEKG